MWSAALSDFERRLFSERRIRMIGGVMLAANILIFAWLLLSGHSVTTPDGRPRGIDFVQFYLSGSFAGSARPASVYDHAAFAAAQRSLVGAPDAGFPSFHFLYPPTFMLITRALAPMPYFIAFAAWLGTTLLLYETSVRAIIPRVAALIAAAIPGPALWDARLGQNGFLTAGLMGLALVFVERRPFLAGVFIGLLSYKPQFALLFPLALVAGGRWKAFVSAALSTLILIALAATIYGPDAWASYFTSMRGFNAALSPDQQVACICQSMFGGSIWFGLSPLAAWVMHLAAATIVTVVVCMLWFLPLPFPLKAAALCVGSAAITPYVLTYDLCILTIAVAFLVQDGLSRGFHTGERIILLLCLVASSLLVWPFAPVIYAALLGVVIWRSIAARRPTSSRVIGPPVPGLDG